MEQLVARAGRGAQLEDALFLALMGAGGAGAVSPRARRAPVAFRQQAGERFARLEPGVRRTVFPVLVGGLYA